MPLIKKGEVISDPWIAVADNDTFPASGPVLVPLSRWSTERDELLARGTPIGVRLASDELVSEIAPDLEHISLIALEFPTFRDGRAYSTARLLRERHGYSGELRAVGNVLRDQLMFMHRCGFDAFEVADANALDCWRKTLAEITVWYQPTADGRIPATALRRVLRAAE
jgi:uncharacterized protein (DUF934 family)